MAMIFKGDKDNDSSFPNKNKKSRRLQLLDCQREKLLTRDFLYFLESQACFRQVVLYESVQFSAKNKCFAIYGKFK